MAKVSKQIKAQISMAWWWPAYTSGVVLMCKLTGQLPDQERFGYWFAKAVRVRIIYAPRSEDA